MISVNNAEVSGRLTHDPETITTPAGTIITNITIANNYLSTAPGGEKKRKR
jgi:single-stranded DNA-binding protein